VTKPRPRQEICQNPERVKKSAAVVVLVGEKAKSLQFSDGNWYWRNDFGLLIVVVNLNNKTGIDKELCPPLFTFRSSLVRLNAHLDAKTKSARGRIYRGTGLATLS